MTDSSQFFTTSQSTKHAYQPIISNTTTLPSSSSSSFYSTDIYKPSTIKPKPHKTRRFHKNTLKHNPNHVHKSNHVHKPSNESEFELDYTKLILFIGGVVSLLAVMIVLIAINTTTSTNDTPATIAIGTNPTVDGSSSVINPLIQFSSSLPYLPLTIPSYNTIYYLNTTMFSSNSIVLPNVWVSATNVTLSSSSSNHVQYMIDKTNQHHNFTQNIISAQPLYLNITMNGYPAIYFTPTTYLQEIVPMWPSTTPHTVSITIILVLMIRDQQSTTNSNLFNNVKIGCYLSYFCINNNNQWTIGTYYQGTVADTTTIIPYNKPTIVSIQTDGTSTYTLYINGVQHISTTLTSGLYPNTDVTLNMVPNGIGGYFYLSEFIGYFQQTITLSQLRILEAEIAAQYHIIYPETIPTDPVTLANLLPSGTVVPLFWLNAQALIGIIPNNTNATYWNDYTTNNLNAYQLNSSYQPLFVQNYDNQAYGMRFYGGMQYFIQYPIFPNNIPYPYTPSYVYSVNVVFSMERPCYTADVYGQYYDACPLLGSNDYNGDGGGFILAGVTEYGMIQYDLSGDVDYISTRLVRFHNQINSIWITFDGTWTRTYLGGYEVTPLTFRSPNGIQYGVPGGSSLAIGSLWPTAGLGNSGFGAANFWKGDIHQVRLFRTLISDVDRIAYDTYDSNLLGFTYPYLTATTATTTTSQNYLKITTDNGIMTLIPPNWGSKSYYRALSNCHSQLVAIQLFGDSIVAGFGVVGIALNKYSIQNQDALLRATGCPDGGYGYVDCSFNPSATFSTDIYANNIFYGTAGCAYGGFITQDGILPRSIPNPALSVAFIVRGRYIDVYGGVGNCVYTYSLDFGVTSYRYTYSNAGGTTHYRIDTSTLVGLTVNMTQNQIININGTSQCLGSNGISISYIRSTNDVGIVIDSRGQSGLAVSQYYAVNNGFSTLGFPFDLLIFRYGVNDANSARFIYGFTSETMVLGYKYIIDRIPTNIDVLIDIPSIGTFYPAYDYMQDYERKLIDYIESNQLPIAFVSHTAIYSVANLNTNKFTYIGDVHPDVPSLQMYVSAGTMYILTNGYNNTYLPNATTYLERPKVPQLFDSCATKCNPSYKRNNPLFASLACLYYGGNVALGGPNYGCTSIDFTLSGALIPQGDSTTPPTYRG